MTDLMIIEGPDVKRMTSLEISELVESRHDKVKQSIERLAARAVIELPPMGEVKNHLGQSVKVYLLDKRSSLIVVAQLSPEFTARVVDRWQELEAQVAAPAFLIPQTLPEALRLAADLAEKNGQLQHQIEADRPKTIFADAVSVSKTSILVGELSKLLKQNGVLIGPKRLFAWLRENGYLMKGGASRNMPTQRAMEMGLFEIKEGTVNQPDGSVRITRTTKVTGKGQVYFVNKFLGETKLAA